MLERRGSTSVFICSHSNTVMMRVSRDSSQTQRRCLYALARRRTALRTGKQTVTDRWGASPGRERAAGVAAVRRRRDCNWHVGTPGRADVDFLPANSNICLVGCGPRGPRLSREDAERSPPLSRLMGQRRFEWLHIILLSMSQMFCCSVVSSLVVQGGTGEGPFYSD